MARRAIRLALSVDFVCEVTPHSEITRKTQSIGKNPPFFSKGSVFSSLAEEGGKETAFLRQRRRRRSDGDSER